MTSPPRCLRVCLIAAFLLTVGASLALAQANVIANINVEGARFVSPDGVRAKVNETLKVGQAFDPDAPADQAKLETARRAVLALGFFERVLASVQRGDQGVTLTFSVVEKQRIERITFVGNTIFTDDQLLDVIASRPGQIIDTSTIRRDAKHIEDFYSDNGRMAKVVQAGPQDYGVVTFVISEAVIEDIVFEGLKKTKPGIVRSKLTVKAGDVYDEKKIQHDVQTIFNLGIFDDVKISFRQGVKDPERGIIVVLVIKEKRTGLASFGAGYSSIDHFVGIFSMSETNFRGRAEKLTGTIELGGRRSYELGFVEPSLDKSGTTLEVNVFDTERRRQFLPGADVQITDKTFDEHRKGFNVALGRPISRNLTGTVRLREEKISDPSFQASRTISSDFGMAERTRSSNTDTFFPGFGNNTPPIPPDPDMPPDTPGPGETVLPVVVFAPLADVDLSSLALGATHDTRDLVLNPTRGDYTSFYVEQAGMLGGDSSFTKFSLDARRYIKVNSHKHVIALRLLGGTTLGDLPLVESFSAGGAYTIRGYKEDRFRGKHLAVASAEYRVPFTDHVMGVGFVDFGDAFGGQFDTKIPGFVIPAEDQSFHPNLGYGVGVRLGTEFGTIRLDLGHSVQGSEVHFSFGQAF